MPSLLVIDRDASTLAVFRRELNTSGMVLLTASNYEQGREVFQQCRPNVVALKLGGPDDPAWQLLVAIRESDPNLPVIGILETANPETVFAAYQQGIFDHLPSPPTSASVKRVVGAAFQVSRSMPQDFHTQEPDADASCTDVLIDRSPAMQSVCRTIARVADQPTAVLIRGESGVGKELIAQTIHRHSSRSLARFSTVNCTGVASEALATDLFGKEASSGPPQLGEVERCAGGTLLIDEVADMPLAMQFMLLRLLREQAFERVGGRDCIPSDVRILLATRKDLERLVRDGLFRRDLYYHLQACTIAVPPLRSRKEDLPDLAQIFLRQASERLHKQASSISPKALELLGRYSWPGNVRELRSTIEHAVLGSTGSVLLESFLPAEVQSGDDTRRASEGESSSPFSGFRAIVKQRVEAGTTSLYDEIHDLLDRDLIAQVLSLTLGNQSRAAKILGMTRGSLRGKIRQLGITLAATTEVSDSED